MGNAVFAVMLAAIFAGCGMTNYQYGQGASPITGSAGPAGTYNSAPSLPHCDSPVATVALVEGPLGSLAQYGITSPIPLLRLMFQQSGCFLVVDRADALAIAISERGLAESGMLQGGNNMGRGQMVVADYSITPNVVFTEDHAGQMVGGLLGFVPLPGAALLGAVVGGLRFKEAQAVLFLTDNRSGVQIAAVEGSVSKADWSAGGGLGGIGLVGLLGVGGGASWNTNEGKVVAAALLDAYSKLVHHVRMLTANRGTQTVNAPPAQAPAKGDAPLPVTNRQRTALGYEQIIRARK